MTAQTINNQVKALNEVAQKSLKKYIPQFDEKGKIISIRKKKKLKSYEKNINENTLKRFDFIFSSLSMGNSRQQTIKNFQEEHDCSFYVAQNWYTSALLYLKNNNENEKEYIKEKYEIMLMNLFQQSIEMGDRNEAHKLLQTLIKLNGVNESEKKEITNKFEFKFNTASNIKNNIEAQNIEFEELDDDDDENIDKDEE